LNLLQNVPAAMRRLVLAGSVLLASSPVLAQSPASPPPPAPQPPAGNDSDAVPRMQPRGPSPALSAACGGGQIPMVVRSSVIPDAPSAYKPLSGHCKFQAFVRQTYSPYTFVTGAFEATWAQMLGEWPEYGGGMEGWGRRFGTELANTESRRFFQTFLFATLLHQDPRYFPSDKDRFVARSWYAATRVLVTKSDRGESQFNTSEVLAALFSSGLENAYYPERDRAIENTMARFAGAIGADAATDGLHEFAPDLRRLFHRHAPRKVQQIEQKLPIPPGDK
jgi:hypothetical protein